MEGQGNADSRLGTALSLSGSGMPVFWNVLSHFGKDFSALCKDICRFGRDVSASWKELPRFRRDISILKKELSLSGAPLSLFYNGVSPFTGQRPEPI